MLLAVEIAEPASHSWGTKVVAAATRREAPLVHSPVTSYFRRLCAGSIKGTLRADGLE